MSACKIHDFSQFLADKFTRLLSVTPHVIWNIHVKTPLLAG